MAGDSYTNPTSSSYDTPIGSTVNSAGQKSTSMPRVGGGLGSGGNVGRPQSTAGVDGDAGGSDAGGPGVYTEPSGVHRDQKTGKALTDAQTANSNTTAPNQDPSYSDAVTAVRNQDNRDAHYMSPGTGVFGGPDVGQMAGNVGDAIVSGAKAVGGALNFTTGSSKAPWTGTQSPDYNSAGTPGGAQEIAHGIGSKRK